MSTEQPTAFIYLRVSTAEQAERGGDGEGFSIPAQREACIREAESLGAMVVGEYVDRGESARSSARPQLQDMLRALTEMHPSYVIVHKVDRLARNRADDVEITMAVRGAGATLVSCSESIDETPSGILMHGILSTMAEFYSANLANEVKKGSLQKAKAGGTVGKAPCGYLNVRKTINGREVRTVDIDEQRAPLMRYAFERYADGDISLRDLLDDVTMQGLDTTPGPKTPSKPLKLSHFHRLLQHPYYKGFVRYKGVVYPGKHPALVSEATWNKVQERMAQRSNSGEKQRKHHHYLKGSVWCGSCGSRLIVSNAKNRHGTIYPYFICIGRQEKRTDCEQSAMLQDTVEELIVQRYRQVQPKPELIDAIRNLILDELQIQQRSLDEQRTAQEKRRAQLLDEREKLLKAHYADAIPLDQLKREQARIAHEIEAAETLISAADIRFELVRTNLHSALAQAGDWGAVYRAASPTIRRQMNQSIFTRFEVDNLAGGTVTSEFAEPFDLLLSDEVTEAAEQHVVYLRENPNYVEQQIAELYREWEGETEKQETPPLMRRGLSKTILVGHEGLEPPTPCASCRCSSQLS